MPSLIPHLSKRDQQQLSDDLNYLHLAEAKSFCKRHSLPFNIWYIREDGKPIRTQEEDRKGIILDRIRHYLATSEIGGPTLFPSDVVCFDLPAQAPGKLDRIFYGQYGKANSPMIALLKTLTDEAFKDGAIARILINEFWRNGSAPTFQEYASSWLAAVENHNRPNPEWAFLSDRAAGKGTADWKQLREKKAQQVVALLERIP